MDLILIRVIRKNFTNCEKFQNIPYSKIGVCASVAFLGMSMVYLYNRRKNIKAKPFEYIPKVSEEAQKYLKTSTPVGGGQIKSLETWKLIRGFFRKATIDFSLKAKEEYVEKVEEKIIENVPVLVVTPKNYDGEKTMVYFHGGRFYFRRC